MMPYQTQDKYLFQKGAGKSTRYSTNGASRKFDMGLA